MARERMRERKALKVALFGFGKMGMHHLNIIKPLPNAELVGIADPRINEQDIRELVGSEVIIAATPEALLEKVKPDVVHIVTPAETHYALGMLAIKNGIHVYIEKPFALKERNAREMVQAALSKGLRVCAGHQLLAHEATRMAEKSLPHIGEIVHAESYFSFRKVRKSLSDVDQLTDILPHPVYTLLHFLRIGSREGDLLVQDIVSKTTGEVRAMVGYNGHEGVLIVSLKGRPVDSYLRIVGTNGSLQVDYVRGITVNLTGAGADAIAAITNPYRQGTQVLWKTTRAFMKMAMSGQKGYAGLRELIAQFYQSIMENRKPPVHWKSIVDTVRICEKISFELKGKEKEAESEAISLLEEEERRLPTTEGKGRILVTGGTGFLGKVVAKRLRSAGRPVRIVSRRVSPFSERIPGVEYAAADLGGEVPSEVMQGVSAVIHCAAETSGGMGEQEKNSVRATRNILEAAGSAGISKFVHISSLAVLKPGRNSGKRLNEASPVDRDNIGRGPYVWGKERAEETVINLGRQLGIDAKIVRPGPLVDFERFEAPGRLGREVGSYFVVMGGRKSPLSVCNVHTAAEVIERYLDDYDSAPGILNLVEPKSLSREDVIATLIEKRKDLRALYVPSFLITLGSSALKVLQKIISPSRKPLDIAAAFASERYDTTLVKSVLSGNCSSQKHQPAL